MSHSNSHHPQPRGQRRARSPEPPPPLGPRTPSPDGPTLVTKSPHTNRTVKKGKVSDKLTQKPSARAPSHPPANAQFPATTSISTEPRTPPTERPDRASAAQAILEALTSQLEAALRTIETLTNTHPDLAHLDVDRTRQVLTKCHKLLEPKAPPREAITLTEAEREPKKPTTSSHNDKKTYAQATASTKTSHSSTQCPTTPRPRTSKPSPPRNVGFVRIIVDFKGNCAKRPRPVEIRDYLNQKFQVIDVKFAAAEFSAAGNLILTVTSSNARHLQAEPGFLHAIRQHVANILELDEDDFTAYPDKPWHRIVINRISLEDVRKAAEPNNPEEMLLRLWEELKTYNPPICQLFVGNTPPERSSRFLLRDLGDFLKKDTVSMCIAFEDIKLARRMVQDGAFIFGKHYKVSWYRSRSRSRR
ncbi:hypothetical protein CVT26_014199 [Gymnopilus dilepis]|uniref:Uncharacterized protein n=1 Tax=Gymnopilus dilepis TaxID=231916 RepID=A0A409VUA0_9AGAR|nr:hypothetical protein CVT26_014199 [Gymnopilus dilepis]